MKYRPTAEDKRIIRDCAQRSSGHKRVSLRIGERHNLEKDVPRSTNIARVSDDPDWNDTDLYEHHDWAAFTKGVELTDDGRGVFDFYVYSTGRDGELETNVWATYKDGKLVEVEGVGDGVIWKAS
jgi:hypothetical protein